jgi:poly [ADP-ribose] polymerase 7/11/12/13
MEERKYWCSNGLDSTKLFNVRAGTQEYAMISTLFHKTLPNHSIDSMQRVENGALHERYIVHKSTIRNELGWQFDENSMVKYLFHGTAENSIHDIVNHGFQPLRAGTNVGAIYGHGTYFARDARYSLDYACTLPSGQIQMLVTRVVLGLWTKGKEGMKDIPPLPREKSRKYHSLVDDVTDPSIYVIQHASQTYPAYLLIFHLHE